MDTLKFLRCMREKSEIESVLTEGFIFQDHEVGFRPSDLPGDMESLITEVWPCLIRRLEAIGRPWETLDETRRMLISRGIGTITGKVPMICFTEVPKGRELFNHQFLFGAYGLVVKRQWLDENKADRVIYVGQNSSVSRLLYRNLTHLRIESIVRDDAVQVLFTDTYLHAILDLITYIQIRDNIEEFEWRIVGKHGFLGGERDTGRRIHVQIDDIEYVLVQKEDDVAEIKKIITNLAAIQKSRIIPKVLCQPETIH